MLWVYDTAIVDDLSSCISSESSANPVVKLMGEEGIMGIFAQLQEDRIKFPALFLNRHPETPLDQTRYNFTRLHKGIPAVYDPEANNLYMEKVAPIQLAYDLHVLTTNTIDMDEIIKELLFRYSSMYYITIQLPYESKRKLRFGVAIDPSQQIRRKSGLAEYIQTGMLYESIIELKCEGAVLVSYTPKRMQRMLTEDAIRVMGVGVITKDSNL